MLLLPGFFSPECKAARPDTVKIGCYVLSLHDFNFREKEYTARLWLWMLYSSDKFDLEDQIEIPNAKTIEKPDVLIDQLDSTEWLQMKMKCVMKQPWRVVGYPFDRQTLTIHVENSKFDINDLVFIADTVGFPYDPELTVEGWRITDFKVTTSTTDYATAFGDPHAGVPSSSYSKFSIIIQLKRNAWGLFIKVFLGMYVSFSIAFIGFFISTNDVEPRFGLPVGGVFSCVGNKYVIDSILPESTGLTLVDLLHGLTLISIFLIIAISAFSLRYYRRGARQSAAKLDKRGMTVVAIIFFVANVVLIGLALGGAF